jgi:hypothetical protein
VFGLAGEAGAVAIATGSLTAQIRIEGAALAQALAAGSLTTEIPLAGAAIVAASSTAALRAGRSAPPGPGAPSRRTETARPVNVQTAGRPLQTSATHRPFGASGSRPRQLH